MEAKNSINFVNTEEDKGIFVSTIDSIPNHEIIEYLGIVFGITVRSRGLGGRCIGGCEACVGGEVSAFTTSSIEARNDAINRLCNEVRARGGNAVIGVRFDSSRSGQDSSMTDIVAYGTAVKVRPIDK
ncbi:MAG: YbjQ family protein [Candidatus Hodarchaeales archaeon]